MQKKAELTSTCCRFCEAPLTHSFCDLGISPLANSFPNNELLQKAEPFYPLHAYVCESCFLVQLQEFESPQYIFSEYSYFSSYSDSWLEHCEAFAENSINRFHLNDKSQVIEIASNDGYLLKYFKKRSIPVLGIEPAKNIAKVAESIGIPTLTEFFSAQLAQKLSKEKNQADLLIGNNVLAHVPRLNDFVKGLKILLKSNGIITMEFPHLAELMRYNQFDTIYHEHFSYFSFTTVEKIFKNHGLALFDVQEISTHGGSLRIFAKHIEDNSKSETDNIFKLRNREKNAGLMDIKTYQTFSDHVLETKFKLLEFLIKAKRSGKKVVGYGAPAKGNTLLNYCGIKADMIDYTVDRNPHKQGCFLPGTHIPIYHPEKITETKPNYLLILPWNIQYEVVKQMSFIREWGGKFVVPIPEVKIL
ncbi:MAG: class I SAM-dependent methyltransferase [Nitrospina sp.]|nr:class I SAM-dependent methyltransferase [Nitrospina sp.]